MTSPPSDSAPREARPRSRGGHAYAAFAFGPGGAIYDLLTDQPAWRRDCRELGALVNGPRVLDLGVGSGLSVVEMARAVPARQHVGVDLAARMLRRARARGLAEGFPVPLLRADVTALPFRDGAFDGATGHSILYLVDDPAAALAELRRVLRPGGQIAFLEPRAGAPPLRPPFRDGLRHGLAMALWRTMSRLHRRYDERALCAALSAAGFRDARAWPVLDGFGVMATAARA